MPGLLTRLDVEEGDKVEAGQPLAVVEAMKMENILRAEKAGTVKAVAAQAGREPGGRRGDPGVRMSRLWPRSRHAGHDFFMKLRQRNERQTR